MTTCAARALRLACGALLPILGASACDFPTSLPRFETQFGIPLDATTLSVSQFLPAGVTVTASSFQVTVAPSSSQRTLAQMCAPCSGLDGMQVPKPAFTDVFQVVVALPQDLVSAEVVSGTVNVTVSHNLGFDPVRPAGSTQGGVILVVVRSGGREVGRDSITGTFTQPVTRSMGMLPGPVTGSLVAEVTIVSPAGNPVTINNSSSISVVVAPGTVVASAAQVQVQNRQVSADALVLDLTNVDADLRGRVQRATLLLNVANPLTVGGTLELRLHAPGVADIRRSVQVGPGVSILRVELSQEDVRGLLGQTVNVSLTGPVNATAGPVTVRPSDVVTITPRLNLVLEIGS
ncbi:hypothetical protein BH23GEM9_BH23GEM9_29880 [soil metagenome]